MPQITNTFLKSKMNKDLDSRILPNGEYRDARNLQISRSQGSEVGEFENILGNTQLKNLYTGEGGKFIGQFTNDTTADIYLYNTSYDGESVCPRDTIVYFNSFGATNDIIVLQDSLGNVLNPQTLGLEVGMLLWGSSWGLPSLPSGIDGLELDPVIKNITTTNIEINQLLPSSMQVLDKIYINYNNTIHRYNTLSNELVLLVRGGFLNFNKNNRITGINLIEDLLFWTDNRNQPRKINISLANPLALSSPVHYVNEDQISVAKYYPYETPLVLDYNIKSISAGAQAAAPLKGYVLTLTDTTNIKIGDIATGFPGQGAQELWNVISIKPGVDVTIYSNFKDGSATMTPGTYNGLTTERISFKRPSSKNLSERKNTNGFDTTVTSAAALYVAGTDVTVSYNYYNQATDQSPQPTPRVGDFITSIDMGITLVDEVCIQQITSINAAGVGGTMVLQFTKDVTIVAPGDDITISANPNYDSTFGGDPDLIEEKFVRFSYRFKFEDNEYSLAAPYTQICFIPKHAGLFGGGQNESLQDMQNAYDSTVVEWFTNNIDTVSLKIPLPETGNVNSLEALNSLINDYKITNIEILYKESDALSTKIIESIDINNGTLLSFFESIPSDGTANSENWYYNFDYKSIKAFRTLPTSEQNRVYDNVPIKALAQEVTANRVMYGNFVQKHTPPNNIDYEVITENKSLNFDNYAQYSYHTVKQNRNYQAGFVLSDRYGRASSVVLSSNDDNPNIAGSTVYVPYTNFNEVDNPIDDVTVYKWLGNALRLKVNNGITQVLNNSQTGEPGLYKSWSDTEVDSAEVLNGGTNYVVGEEISTVYNASLVGQGSGLRLKIETVGAGGVIEAVSVIDRGQGYVNNQVVDYNSGSAAGAGATFTVTVNPPNVTGWQSYKIVVKQQEQEYYNVYLAGYVSGYPEDTATDYGRIAFTALFGDNINKVPRDVQEIGPTDTEFSSSVTLFGRVNNPNINNQQKGGAGNFYYENREYPWNCQYYPGRVKDEVVTIGPIGAGGLELANSPFSANTGNADKFNNEVGNAKIPWGGTGQEQSFHNVEQNPLCGVIKIGAEETQPNLTQPGSPQLNTLGAKVTDNPIPPTSPPSPEIGCMVPFLSVSETSPVESALEIFYESSTAGNFIDLNRAVIADYGGVSKVSSSIGSFDESDTVGTDIITAFSFEDSIGNSLLLDGVPLITQVLDSNGNDVTGIFSITETVPTVYDDFDLETNSLFWYGSPTVSKSNQWFITFQTTYISGPDTFVDVLTNAITVNLNNIAPTIGGFTPTQTTSADNGVQQACGKVGGTSGYDTTMTGVFGQFTNAKNSSADVPNQTQELCYTLSVTAEPVGSTAVWSIDQTGTLSLTSGTLINGTYTFECTVTDASLSCVSSAGSLPSIPCQYDLVFGTPPTNKAICFGPTSQMNTLDTSCGPSTGTGKPLEVFFGANQSINSGVVGGTGSGTQTILATIDTALGSPSNGYGLTSSNSTNLRYYNVRQEANTTADPIFQCIPPITFTTGALDQGIIAIQAVLTKTATVSPDNEYKTNFTILYRATPTDAWTLATCLPTSPAQPLGGTVGNFNLLEVVGAGGATASLTYYFENVGEYAVRNNGVYSVGCTACSTCAEFTVDYYDALQAQPVAAPCVDCLGPL